MNVTSTNGSNTSELLIQPVLERAFFRNAIGNLKSLDFGDDSSSFQVLVEVDDLGAGRVIGGERTLAWVANIDEGQLGVKLEQ